MARALISFVAICLLLSPLGEARTSGNAPAGMSEGAYHGACCSDPEECQAACEGCITGCAPAVCALDTRRDAAQRPLAMAYDYRADSRASWTDPPAGEPPK